MHDRKAIVRIVVLSLLLYALVSFAAAQGELRQTRQTESRLREELEKVLRHELRHHVEALAGEYDLIDEDRQATREYLQKHMDQ